MSTYRTPNTGRIAAQMSEVSQYAGQVVTWKQYISASAGIPVAGIGSAAQYRQQAITALLRWPTLREMQTYAGMIAAGDVIATTREKLARRDELLWRGQTYRVESDPVPAVINQHWTTILKRGSP